MFLFSRPQGTEAPGCLSRTLLNHKAKENIKSNSCIPRCANSRGTAYFQNANKKMRRSRNPVLTSKGITLVGTRNWPNLIYSILNIAYYWQAQKAGVAAQYQLDPINFSWNRMLPSQKFALLRDKRSVWSGHPKKSAEEEIWWRFLLFPLLFIFFSAVIA